MKEIIRSITKEDFEEVSALHDFDNDVDELKWLYRDTDDKNTYNGFVAVNTNNEILFIMLLKLIRF